MSTPLRRIAGLLLGLAFAASVHAQSAAPGETIPTWEQLKEWKSRIIDPYKSATYLEVNGRPMTEAAFMRALHDDHPTYKMDMTDVDGRKEKIVLQILPPESKDKTSAP